MSQRVTEITTSESDPPPQPPPHPHHRLMSISSGPMAEGLIPSVRADDGVVEVRKRKGDSTEHVCMFSICLMFIGIPIIVIGILCLSFAAPIGIIMTMVGVGASVSGAVLILLSGIIALAKACIKPKPRTDYGEGEAPEIIVDETLYSEHFSDNLCEESHPEELTVEALSDLPSLEKLDPVYWSNYPEAQNPKSYLQSFGDLPKVIPSPDPRAIKKGRFSKKSKTSGKRIRRKISSSLGIAPKKKTLSRTSLTRDFSEEIQSDSSTSLSSTSSNRSKGEEHNSTYYKVSANGYGVNDNNQSIITIENDGHNLTTDDNEDKVITTGVVTDSESNHSSDQMNNKIDNRSVEYKLVVKEQNNRVNNGFLPDESTDSIELTEIMDRNGEDKDKHRYIRDEEFDRYSDLWNSIRRDGKP